MYILVCGLNAKDNSFFIRSSNIYIGCFCLVCNEYDVNMKPVHNFNLPFSCLSFLMILKIGNVQVTAGKRLQYITIIHIAFVTIYVRNHNRRRDQRQHKHHYRDFLRQSLDRSLGVTLMTFKSIMLTFHRHLSL